MPTGLEGILLSSPTIVTGVPTVLTNHELNSHREQVQNWLTNPDEVIQNMPELDRRMFTQEGVDSLREATRNSPEWEGASEDRLDDHVFYELATLYNRYKKK